MKFKYKENNYWLRDSGEFLIRSTAGLCGYSYFRITDPGMIKILTEHLHRKIQND